MNLIKLKNYWEYRNCDETFRLTSISIIEDNYIDNVTGGVL